MNILITGCTSGLGYELSILLQRRENNNLFLISKNKRKLSLFKKYKNIKTYNLNLQNLNRVNIIVKKISKDSRNSIDVIICNAAEFTVGSSIHTPVKIFKNDLNVNFFSNLIIIKRFLPLMIKRNGGHVINISSGAAIVGKYDCASYSVSKGATQVLFESMRLESLPSNVFIKNFFPGIMDTKIKKKIKNYSIENSGKISKVKINRTSTKKVALKIVNSLYTKNFNNFISKYTIVSFIIKLFPSFSNFIYKFK